MPDPKPVRQAEVVRGGVERLLGPNPCPVAVETYDKNGVIYLGDGSWGKIRAPKKPEVRPYLATVAEAYHMTVHRLEGKQRFHVALSETGKVEDVYMTINKRPARRG